MLSTQKTPGYIFGSLTGSSPFWLVHEYVTLVGISQTHEMGPVVPRVSEELILRAAVMTCTHESWSHRYNASQFMFCDRNLAVLPGFKISFTPTDWWIYGLSHNFYLLFHNQKSPFPACFGQTYFRLLMAKTPTDMLRHPSSPGDWSCPESLS